MKSAGEGVGIVHGAARWADEYFSVARQSLHAKVGPIAMGRYE
jgi:hypothetical protein